MSLPTLSCSYLISLVNCAHENNSIHEDNIQYEYLYKLVKLCLRNFCGLKLQKLAKAKVGLVLPSVRLAEIALALVENHGVKDA